MNTSRISNINQTAPKTPNKVEVIYIHDALSEINRKYEFDGLKLVIEISRPLSGLEIKSSEYKQDSWNKLKQHLSLGLSINII